MTDSVGKLSKNLSIISAAIGLAWVVCAGLAFAAVGGVGLAGASLAAAVTLVSGVVVAVLLRSWGSSPVAVLGITFVRLLLVAAGAAAVWQIHGALESKSFLLSVGATYLAALAAETWLLLENKPAVFSLLFKSRVEAK